MSFEGRVAFVTGGSSGIGRATALRFADEGAKVAIAARRTEQGEAVAQEIRDRGGEAIFTRTDVSVPADVEAAVGQAVEAFGRLDFAFNNAGTLPDRMPLHEIDLATWERSLAVNLTGLWLCMKFEIIQMLEQGGGAIVNDPSVGGLKSGRNAAAYVAAKHGVIGLTKTAAVERVRDGIRINAVCPGFIDTPMTESFYVDAAGRERIVSNQASGRAGEPAEVAAAVTWLCSDAASFVTGVALPVDGGILAS